MVARILEGDFKPESGNAQMYFKKGRFALAPPREVGGSPTTSNRCGCGLHQPGRRPSPLSEPVNDNGTLYGIN